MHDSYEQSENKAQPKNNFTFFFHFILSVSNKYNAIASINLIYTVQYLNVAWFPAQMFHDIKNSMCCSIFMAIYSSRSSQ